MLNEAESSSRAELGEDCAPCSTGLQQHASNFCARQTGVSDKIPNGKPERVPKAGCDLQLAAVTQGSQARFHHSGVAESAFMSAKTVQKSRLGPLSAPKKRSQSPVIDR
jgi:hypothetical protein